MLTQPKKMKLHNFSYFKSILFNFASSIERNNRIKEQLRINGLLRKEATSIGNNCLLDTIYQLILHYLLKNGNSSVDQLGSLTDFINAIRSKIDKENEEQPRRYKI